MAYFIVILRAALLSVLFAASVPRILRAQVISLVKPHYIETFVKDPRVSGSLLVGLVWAPARGIPSAKNALKFDPGEVGIFLLPFLQGRKACVEVSSQDGRYFAQNLYELPARQGPENFQVDTRYAPDLKHYPAHEMAVSVRVVDDCDSAERGFLVPARINDAPVDASGSNANGRSLVAYMNADAQDLKVYLRRKGAGEMIQSTCNPGPDDAVKISFSSSCTFDTPATGDYDLIVDLQERFKSRKSLFKVSVR